MKSKDVQKIVLSKYQNHEPLKKIFRDLNGAVGYSTIRKWCKMIRDTGEIDSTGPNGCPGIIRTKETIRKAKIDLKGVKPHLLEN